MKRDFKCECSLMYESEPKQSTTNFVLLKQLYNHSHCFMFICVGRTVAIRLSRSGDSVYAKTYDLMSE